MYEELIGLLSCGMIEDEERQEMTEEIVEAPDNPAYEWALGNDAMARACALSDVLVDYSATGDKVDEVHEQIQDMFEEEFPGFPYEMFEGNKALGLPDYYDWLDKELAQRAVEEGGYEAVMLDTGADDNMSVFIVYRRDTDRVLELARDLKLRMYRPRQQFGNDGAAG